MQLLRKETSSIPAYSRLYGASIEDFVVVDCQDLVVGGGSVDRFNSLAAAAAPLFQTSKPVVSIGGDHSITMPLLRSAREAISDFAVIHIDKDLAIGSGSREQALTTDSAMFWGAASKLFDVRHSIHVGVRGNLPSQKVELLDQELGFKTILAEEFVVRGVNGIVEIVKARLGRRDGSFMPAYLSLDLDVLDLWRSTAIDEPGGLSFKELRAFLVLLRTFCVVRGAELRGVGTLTDPASLKVAAAIAHDLVLLAGVSAGNVKEKEIQSSPLQEEL